MSVELKIAVFASGKGSNLKAIIEAINNRKLTKSEIRIVISNNSTAGVLDVANKYGITTMHCSRLQYESEAQFETALLKLLEQYNVNFIVLAGYMKKIGTSIIQRFKNRIINIHPALLPAFGGHGMYGMRVHEAVIENREPISGATVHIVDEEYDRGPIILKKSVPVDLSDTPETLAAKVHTIEHELYPEAIRLFEEGNIRIEGRTVRILNPS